MKKYLLITLLFLLIMLPVKANTRKTVEFSKCTDGDTAHFLIDGKDTTVRFLAIDTPEYTKEKEPYGKEASDYTCSAITNAKNIELEYDDGSQVSDKYGRVLAWVFVDGTLLQKQLIEEGLAEVAYVYGDYAYTVELEEAQEQAKQKRINIWSDEAIEEESTLMIYVGSLLGVVLIVIIALSNTKGKKRKINQVKKAMKKLNQR